MRWQENSSIANFGSAGAFWLTPPKNSLHILIHKAVEDVKPNFILNATIGYEVYRGVYIFVNARNIMGINKCQFAITNKINAMILAGVNINI